jgi:hypothetical protein
MFRPITFMLTQIISMGFLKMAKNDKNPNFLPVSPDAIFGSFQGKIISHFIDTSMISKTGSSLYLYRTRPYKIGVLLLTVL